MSIDPADRITAQVIADLAESATEPTICEPGKIYTWLSPDGDLKALDLTGDEYLPSPKRKRGKVTVEDVASFAHYYAKHAQDGISEVFANLDAALILANLDADGDGPGEAGWNDHKLILALRKTEPWADWTGKSGQMMTQATFAEFLEDHATDLAAGEGISAADLIEVAQAFQAHTRVSFKSGARLQSGATQLQYEETIDASAGDRGTIEVPSQFVLALRPFDDAEPVAVLARFRYRLTGGQLTLGYKLDQADRIFREAVKEVVAKAQEATGATIMLGTP